VRVSRTNRYHVRIVTRRADCGVTVCAGTVVLTHITGGDDHDSCSPCGFHGLAERIKRIAFIYSAS